MHEINIKEYLHQIWKRRKIAGLFLASVVVVTMLVTFRQPKIYRAATVVEIGAETPDIAFFQDVVNVSPYSWWSALKYYETQYQIIKSRALMTKAADRGVERNIVTGFTKEQLTSHLLGGVSVISDEKSRLASITFDDTDSKRAQTLANLISDTYVDENLAQKLQGVTQAVNWLNDRLHEIQKEKSVQEDALQKYKEEYKVVSIEDKENVAKANLLALTDTLNRLKSQRIEQEAQYRKLNELVSKMGRTEDLLGVVNNELLTKLKQDLADRRTERSQLSQRYMEKHPTILRVNAEILETERAIRLEVENEVSRLKTKFLLAKEQEESIAKALEQQKLEALRIDEVNRKLNDIKIVADTNQQLFQTLQKKIKEADLSALVRSNNIRIMDRALEPTSPISPNYKRNFLLALIIGVLGAIGLALGMEYLDDTFKTHDDIERYLKLPVLGFIPHFESGGNGAAAKRIEFIPFEEPTATLSEAYRALRTNVLFLAAARGLKKVVVVSTGPAEGKTITSINLGVTLAQTGEKTIVVDLDLRRPKLHYAFESETRTGITNILVGEAKLQDVIRKSQIPNLDYLLAGAIPPNPAELLGSPEMKKVLEELSKRYDRVILDSSPIAPVTDAAVIAQQVDGVILIVRATRTHRKAVSFALDQLRNIKAEVLGVVLNDVDVTKSTYSNYQYYKYGYYTYGETPSEKKTKDVDPSGPSLPAGQA